MARELLERAVHIGGEYAIRMLFELVRHSKRAIAEDRIPFNREVDTVVYEMAFKFGRADIVVFHLDGSASVIEVKDGTKGYNHVVSGIGQAGLYAAQLAMSKGSLRIVRKCLLWTSTGNVAADSMIEMVCEQSSTIPLPWGKLSDHIQVARQTLTSLQSED